MATAKEITVMESAEASTVMESAKAITVMESAEASTDMKSSKAITVMESSEASTVMESAKVENNYNIICQIGESSDDVIAYEEYSQLYKEELSMWRPDNTPTEQEIYPSTLRKYTHQNPSENIPIILLHELMRAKETWDECGRFISARTNSKVYSLDARNHGDSKWVETMDYDSMADDVVQFMNAMSIPKAIIVGHGMGGKTGMVLALKYPNRTHALILEDTSMYSHSKSRERFQKSVEKCYEILNFISRSKDLTEAKRMAVSFLTISPTVPRHYYYRIKKRKSKPRIWEGVDLPLKTNAGGGFEWKLHLKSIAENMSSETWKQSGVFDGPVLVIYGTWSSNKVLDDRVEFLRQFPRTLYKPIEEGVIDYPLHIEYPDKFTEIVCDFILKQRGEK